MKKFDDRLGRDLIEKRIEFVNNAEKKENKREVTRK